MCILPVPCKCNRCGRIEEYGQHDKRSAPTTSDGEPVCSWCWDDFIETNLGILEYIKPATTNLEED